MDKRTLNSIPGDIRDICTVRKMYNLPCHNCVYYEHCFPNKKKEKPDLKDYRYSR